MSSRARAVATNTTDDHLDDGRRFHPVQKPRESNTITHNYSGTCLQAAISARAGSVKRVRAHAHESLHGLDGHIPGTLINVPIEGFFEIRKGSLTRSLALPCLQNSFVGKSQDHDEAPLRLPRKRGRHQAERTRAPRRIHTIGGAFDGTEIDAH